MFTGPVVSEDRTVVRTESAVYVEMGWKGTGSRYLEILFSPRLFLPVKNLSIPCLSIFFIPSSHFFFFWLPLFTWSPLLSLAGHICHPRSHKLHRNYVLLSITKIDSEYKHQDEYFIYFGWLPLNFCLRHYCFKGKRCPWPSVSFEVDGWTSASQCR